MAVTGRQATVDDRPAERLCSLFVIGFARELLIGDVTGSRRRKGTRLR